MRRLESGLAKRTHGVRPSEKTAFAPSRGLSPLAKPRWGRPRRGGAGSARPQRGPRLDRDMSPVGHWASVCPCVSVLCIGLRQASLCGRGDRVPPRKSAFAPSPAPPRKAILACIAHPGGAGSARPRRIHPVEQGNPHQAIGFWPIVAH